MTDREDADQALEDQEKEKKTNKAFEAGFESDDSYNLDDADNKDTPIEDPEDSANIDNKPEDQKIDADPTINVDEWEGVPDPIRKRFEQMSMSLEKATSIANSASGRANKLQGELHNYKKAPPAKVVPTDQQLRDAMGNQEKLEALKEDWPDLAGAMEELKGSVTTAVGGGLDRVKNEVLREMQDYTAKSQEQLANRIKLDNLHPGWQDNSNSDEFKGWIYDGGPNSQEQKAYDQLLSESASIQNSSPARSAELSKQAAEYFNNLLDQYPIWAGEKGNLYGDSSVNSAIKLLDMHKKAFTVTKKDTNLKNKQVLADNVTPTSGKGIKRPTDSSVDVQAAFKEGFTSNNY
jgi:hypothetical protein